MKLNFLKALFLYFPCLHPIYCDGQSNVMNKLFHYSNFELFSKLSGAIIIGYLKL